MTACSSAMFYCTNTDSIIGLNGAQLVLSEEGTLLTVSAGRWGREGRKGRHCVLNARDRALEGSIAVGLDILPAVPSVYPRRQKHKKGLR